MKKQISAWIQSLMPGFKKKEASPEGNVPSPKGHTNFTNSKLKPQTLNNPAHQDLLNHGPHSFVSQQPLNSHARYNQQGFSNSSSQFLPRNDAQSSIYKSKKLISPQPPTSFISNPGMPDPNQQTDPIINNNHQSQQPVVNKQFGDSNFAYGHQQQAAIPLATHQQQYLPPVPSQPFYPTLIQENIKFNHEEVKFLLPKPIAREIVAEKIRTILMMIFGSIGLVITTALVVLYYVAAKQGTSSILGINTKVIPLPVFTISALVLCLALIIWGGLEMHQILLEAEGYLRKRRLGYDDVPQFIITNFKSSLRRKIVINWVFIPLYILLALIIGFLIFLNHYQGQSFNIGFWSLGKVPNLLSGITVLAIIIGTMLLIHLINLILFRKRTANIIGYFGSMVMSDQQIIEYTKRINRICLVCFIVALIILFFLISIPILILRRQKASGWKLPWSKK